MTMATAYANDAVVEEFIGAMAPSAERLLQHGRHVGRRRIARRSRPSASSTGATFAGRLKERGPALLEELKRVADAARIASADAQATPLASRLAAVQILGRGLTPHDAEDIDDLG